MVEGDETPFLFVLQPFIQASDVLASATYREFNGKFKTEANKYMAHTLVVYLFNTVLLFVRHAKLPKAVCRVKYDGSCDP